MALRPSPHRAPAPAAAALLLTLVLAPAAAGPARAGDTAGPGDPPEAAGPDATASDAAPLGPGPQDDRLAAEAGKPEREAAAPPEEPPLPTLPLGEVTVTATRAERSVLEVPGNVTVIEREEIERSGERNVADLLRREAGVFVTNTTQSPVGFTVETRGFNNGGGNGSNLLVLVDGRRVNETRSSVSDWALMHLDRVDRIEIVRGPASAVWGDNAMGGVIQILTRRPGGPLRAEIRQRAGTFDLEAGSLFAAGERGPVEASLFADGLSRDGFRERSGFRTRALDGKLRFLLGERASFELSGGYTSDDRDFPGALTEAEIDALGRDAADPSEGENAEDVRTGFVQGRLRADLLPEVTLEVLPFHRERSRRGGSSSADFSFLFDFESEVSGVNVELRIDQPLGGRPNRLILGFDTLFEEADSASRFQDFGFGSTSDDSSEVERRIYGVFLQEELEVVEDVILSAGLRFDHARYKAHKLGIQDFGGGPSASDQDFHETYDQLSPKAALTWRAAEPLSVYASFARGVRFPNFDEAFGFFGFTPELRPATSKSYEVGMKLRMERASANLAVYHMDVEDEIFFNSIFVDPASGFPSPQNVNFDRIRHRGVEVSASVQPVDWLELFGTYTFDDTEIARDELTGLEGEQIPITPRHRGSYGGRLLLPYGIELGLRGHLAGSRFLANDLRNETEKLPKHAVYDALLELRPPLRELVPIGNRLDIALHLAARNVFDREYAEFGGVSSFSGDVGFYPAPGRSYEVGVTLTARRAAQ